MRTHVELTEKYWDRMWKKKLKGLPFATMRKWMVPVIESISGKDLTMGERIVAVADIVSALAGTEAIRMHFPKSVFSPLLIK
ncbi:MAG: hypothetical protein ACLUOI_03865 [Eisenbergiella sp.]